PPAAAEVDQTLFVGNLESRVREEILYELFLQAGPLIKVTICKDKEGKPKSFGFVCFKHKESVPYAVALLNGIRLYGRPIRVQFRFGTWNKLQCIFSRNKNFLWLLYRGGFTLCIFCLLREYNRWVQNSLNLQNNSGHTKKKIATQVFTLDYI
uniref:Splicing regulator RBM11 n=1 Tax=Amazona collaria TaxID=241587 RepID=A0A8B9ISD0_9PSIT